MLTGSAITRALVIVVLAAGLAGLWQFLMPRAAGPHVSEPQKRAEAGRGATPAPTSGDAVRSVYPGGPRPADPPAPRPAPTAEAPPTASPAPANPAPMPAPLPAPAPPPAPAPSPPPPVFTPAAPSAPLPQADTTADASSSGTVDLNTASVAELNGLGGGMIGKAIIAKRPYASPGELLSKRVLSRATYDRIKGQVTVR
ncbi:Helix-hairpin-helix motif-containing protein [Methylobacterium sp. 174MFSha1.1]|uniref:helix-hairpin-helix domain-containing protein n=1 Tax=Methylobacterium sp. 174MFSha1.1 TaxID=1502749 RepID=UPI0008E5EE9D|nr:helix-hairpin-helix domain-containing protein [Methylobacterium sp. 174MFSha1.1]SFV09350.1 Helix-hairpin-helix motif-containing protein [Methylobacterium sp. 174MFSha1.1]